jgi:deoxyribodipyrimidine photo-lyase
MVNRNRIRIIHDRPARQGPVAYWMQRDQRVNDNWALLYAQELALEMKQPLIVVFCLVQEFLEASPRHYKFMFDGLTEVEEKLRILDIPFYFLTGDPVDVLPGFIEKNNISGIISDFNPLRLTMEWKTGVSRAIDIPFIEVDAHNIIPCWITSGKQEFSARTIRGRIQKLLPDYLVPFPSLIEHPFNVCSPSELPGSRKSFPGHFSSVLKTGKQGGENEAESVLHEFLSNKLRDYDRIRNIPEEEGQSGLSPYLHFGQISSQRIALDTTLSENPALAKNVFLEELIVRKELSDNFCFYNKNYDRFEGFHAWAKKSLDQHRVDPRMYCYSSETFENAETHDVLWNAAQKELVIKGKMHGYLRMYWAKKILEWTGSPEEAMAVAVYLNDKYEFDGRDPNGYAGIAWSIGGVHDRPWGERPIFGNVRYMNYNGCLRKFNVGAYIGKVNSY